MIFLGFYHFFLHHNKDTTKIRCEIDMQLLKNLFQVSGDLNGLTWAGKDAGFEDGNSYVLKTGQGLVMFDCGCGDTFDQICQNMAYWNLDIDQVYACFLTHAHLDHAGAAHKLRERNIRLIAHAETAEAISKGDERCCGYLYHKPFIPTTIDQTIKDNETIEILGYQIKALHLPGHTRGCTAYVFEHQDKTILISGDIIGTLLAGDFGWSGSIDFDRKLYIESLRRLAKIDTDIMLPGHGMVYFHKPRRRVEAVLNQALMQWRG
jgi:glyoxylase-like metal-dependent hydrolase (beta-lactamase superfamily II)